MGRKSAAALGSTERPRFMVVVARLDRSNQYSRDASDWTVKPRVLDPLSRERRSISNATRSNGVHCRLGRLFPQPLGFPSQAGILFATLYLFPVVRRHAENRG